jgi:ubiquitin carboxyl-terminal hydrolase 25/28
LIAEYRNSERLRGFLRGDTMTAPEMDLGEAYALWQINDRTLPINIDVMRTQLEFSTPAEDYEKMHKAFKLIEQDQVQNLNNRSHESEARRNSYPLETWPVGLRNIGNTCYLNSVLQFLFTIQPLRELVLRCEDHLQHTSPEALLDKRVGRVPVTAEMVEIAQKFILELRTFFDQLIKAPTDTVRPTIDLAVLALCKTLSPKSVPQASEAKPAQTSDLGSIDGVAVYGPMLPPADNGELAVIDPADSVMGDDQSDTSMQAMNLGDDSKDPDTAASSLPAPPTRPPPVPPRPAPQEKSKISSMEWKASQQDASEILSNIFDLLRCAIKSQGTLEDNEQFDQIKEIFFSDVISVRNTKPKPKTSTEPRDHFLVSPGFRDRSICATLDDEFDEVELDGGLTKYDYIAKPAPVQIINLRRLQFDPVAQRQMYDRSHIRLETPLYLDRYLQKTQTLSELQLLELRRVKWRTQAQLEVLIKRVEELKKTAIEGMNVADAVEETSSFVRDLVTESQLESEKKLPTPPPELADVLSDKATSLKEELANIDTEMRQLESETDCIFKDCKDVPYRLHAVFMHRGSQTSGHYWIYIYDFQNDMWRKYNDDQVDIADMNDVFKLEEGSAPAASTGVVYVREEMVHQLTQAVKREPVAVPSEQPTANGNVETREDIEMREETEQDTQMRDADNDMLPLGPLEVIDGVEQA